jgi:N-carbamoyl-L-amino-acid hydrolase
VTDAQRLERSIEELARIGRTPAGGVSRIALTEADRDGRRLVERRLADLGCSIRRDRIGNVFARREGSVPELPAVMVGSHLDSQPDGGRYDGALGVLAGLEVLRTLDERGLTHRAPIELAIWTDEEGARFDVSCIGSSVYAGALELERALALTDADGVLLRDALGGLAGAHPIGEPLPACYLELHIEQGPHLDRSGRAVAVVDGITGIEWIAVRIVGRTAHAGTTPPEARRDALLAAARLTLAVDASAAARAPAGRGTVCVLRAQPNAGSVVTGETELLVDLRHPSADVLAEMVGELTAFCDGLRADGFAVAQEPRWSQPPIAFHPDCIATLEQAAARHVSDAPRMVSGAGHDAGYLAMRVPTAMLFVACRDGISHHPDEHVRPQDAATATAVLLDAVLELAAR